MVLDGRSGEVAFIPLKGDTRILRPGSSAALAEAPVQPGPATTGAQTTKKKPTGGDPNAPTSGVIKIVSSMPRTGSANAQTTTTVNGIKMAIEERGGKVGNFEIKFEDWDDASAKKGDWDPEVEAANANKAVQDPDVMVYLGTYNSGAAKISMPVLNKAGISMISPANTYTGLTKPGQGEPGEPEMYRPRGDINYFRVVPADDIQGRVAAEWMKQMGAKTVYILDDRSLYGKGIADVFEATLAKVGIQSVGREGIDPKAQEYKSLMTKIQQKSPDWIYFGGTTQTNAGQLVKDTVAIGLTAKIMMPDGCFEDAFIKAAGPENANGRAHLTFGGLPPEKLTGKGADFVKRYKEKYEGDPEGYAVYGYVAAKVALDAIERAGRKDRDAIREALIETEETDGVLGSWKFDPNGDTTSTTMSGNVVKDGKFAFATVLGN
ncbi:MAG: branched-chain amino acid ABC transporter substrate-binding protein [Polyangiaceae bacterium]|nr:branched-chain amino acid ABC transporter substrate-binding protein [Polyangiaceae bacterium]